MSDAGHDELVQEEDHIESKTIIAVGVTALAIFGAGILWAVQIQRDSNGTVRSLSPQEAGVGKKNEVGMVYQTSFDHAFADHLKAQQKAALDSVGWVDAAHTKVHIPIDLAMKQYLAESDKAGGTL